MIGTGDKSAEPNLGQQESTDDGAENADDHIADQTEAAAPHDLAREPARDQPHHQENNETL